MDHGIGPADVDRAELWQLLAGFGQHRHPDWWMTDDELVPPPKDSRRRKGGKLPSQRERTTGRDLIHREHATNAARVAAARDGRPAPARAPSRNQAGLIAALGVTGARK